MAMIDESTIVEAGRRIAAAAPEAKVILFGSHARGTSVDALGDIDLLVIEPSVDDPAEESVRLRRTLKGMGVPVDVVVVDKDRARRRATVPGTMVERALREGRVLVDA
jgi:predicted nucleotidyltransferase